jgi:hypothetical protein
MNEIEKNDHMVSVNFGPLDQKKNICMHMTYYNYDCLYKTRQKITIIMLYKCVTTFTS